MRTISKLYLDFDSFFATAEQHFNPALRDRAVGVVPLDSPHTSCIAISGQAKARGLRSGASVKEARSKIPDMLFVVARHDVYVRLHHRILETVEACLPIEDVRSIDELVCHLLPGQAADGAALGERIKSALSQQFSEVLTCSIGMASTELLAKIAAERYKPDGLCVLFDEDLPEALADLPLRKLPGISDGIERRLNLANIHTFEALWRLGPTQCRTIWRNIEGERFWNELHGKTVERPETQKRMFGHSRILPGDWRSKEKVAMCARQLCLSAARRLRRTQWRATRLSLSFKGDGASLSTHDLPARKLPMHDLSMHNKSIRKNNSKLRWKEELPFAPARDDHTFLQALSQGLTRSEESLTFKPRSVHVTLHGLVDTASMTHDLFDTHTTEAGSRTTEQDRLKWEQLSDVMDSLRANFGPQAISLGPREEMPGGYVGAKIAFGRIPDDADFDQAPVADEDTQFCLTINS